VSPRTTLVAGAALALGVVCCGGRGGETRAGTPVAPRTAASFECSQVIGFSQTNEWYAGGFERVVDNARWQLLWQGGASIELWADPRFSGWSQPLVSPCASRSTSPDRILVTISGAFE